jgi:FKBP-type peptidyl-prolyl cis-trans isomerase
MRSLIVPALLAALAACTPSEPKGPSVPANETYAASLGVDIATMTKVDNNLYYKDITVGTGTPAASYGKTITVTYTGYLVNGTEFDSNVGESPLVKPLTDAELIAGWVVGVDGMKPGGVRKLVIGSSYGYGSQGRGPIPGNATLVFDIELKAVQ